jgi:hypothetical protein
MPWPHMWVLFSSTLSLLSNDTQASGLSILCYYNLLDQEQKTGNNSGFPEFRISQSLEKVSFIKQYSCRRRLASFHCLLARPQNLRHCDMTQLLSWPGAESLGTEEPRHTHRLPYTRELTTQVPGSVPGALHCTTWAWEMCSLCCGDCEGQEGDSLEPRTHMMYRWHRANLTLMYRRHRAPLAWKTLR